MSAGFHPRTHWRAYSGPPGPLAGFKGPTTKGRESVGKESGTGWGKRKGGKRVRGRDKRRTRCTKNYY